jgi:hypothetical protein
MLPPSLTQTSERALPAWLPLLVRLERLYPHGWVAPAGWEVLARLPLLKWVKVSDEVAALQHVPHVFWGVWNS